jgi:DNA-binding CsgD family transcriptional regulator
VSRLAPGAQDLVAAAAVLGQRSGLRNAAAVAAVRDPVAALDDAVAANVLEVTRGAATDAIGFPHPLVRAAVYGDLSPVRVRALHARAAELGGAGSLQHRVAASTGPNAALTAELEAAAERERGRGAHTTAADFLLAAARVAETAERREAAVLAAIEALVVAGDLERAASMRGDAEGCVESQLRSYVLGYLSLLLGQLDVAGASLSEARAGADEDVAAAAGAQLALLRFMRGQVVDALDLANAALRANPSRPGARDLSAYIKTMALVALGRSAEAERAERTLAPLATDYRLDLLVARGTLALQRGDAERARGDLRAAITRAHGGEPLRQVARAHGFLAQAELHLGDWDDALVHAELAVSIAEDSGAPLTYAFAHATASTLSAFRGDLEAAEAYLAAAEVGASALPFWVDVHTVATARARLCLVRSDAPGIVAALEPLDGQLAEYFHNVGLSAPAFLLAEGLIATERVDEALALLDRFDPRTDLRSQSWPALDAARVRGLALAAQGDSDAAAKSFRAGLERAPADSWPLHRARLELAYGTALREKCGGRAVIDVLRAARGRLVRLGARPFLDACDRQLRACGLQPAPDRPDDLLGLTTQERAVVSLVARGLTNREVAAELYVSPKTVEYHLGRVFAKLGVTSRTQLAARIAGAEQND